MEEIKKYRIQLSESEIRQIIYHVNMDLDSMTEVYHDIKDDPAEREWLMDIISKREMGQRLVNKLSRKL